MPAPATPPRVPFGVAGLDEILAGGIPACTLFLVEGQPGSGKTTLGMQYLMEGVRRGEPCLLVTNAETPSDMQAIAASHGWTLDGIALVRWEEREDGADAGSADYTLFPAAEVEVGESLAHLFAAIERVRPARVVIDSISGLRVVARDPAFYRRQLQKLSEFVADRACTSVVIDDGLSGEADVRTQTLAHGLLELERLALHYGGERRRLCVRKLRGSRYVGGYHDFAIETGGLTVFPRLIATAHERAADSPPAESGIAALDTLAGGGLPRGSSTLLIGPTGSGKSTLASTYLHAAAERGERSSLYLFDESPRSYVARSRGLGVDLGRHVEAGRIAVIQVDPAELSPGQIAHQIVRQVEHDDVRLVALDTLNGYLHSAAQEQMVILHLRELLSFLARRAVVTLLTLTEHGILGSEMSPPIDISFLADNVLLFRYFEARGSVHRALSMLKRRTGAHERTIRELRMGPDGVTLSGPLASFSGLLSGSPMFHDSPAATWPGGGG